jgi:chlorite dismutase
MKEKIYNNYLFFDINNRLYQIDPSEIVRYKQELLEICNSASALVIYPYLTLGLKANTVFMLWIQSSEIEAMQAFLNKVRKSSLGQYLSVSHTLFGIARSSVYANKATPQEQAIYQTERERYLIVYPFTKTKEWHLLSLATRKALMNEHMRIGHKFEQIKQNLLYAYGVDDYEFIVSYETGSLPDFQSLVMELRADEARRYTQKDTPIFVCVYKPLEQLIKEL